MDSQPARILLYGAGSIGGVYLYQLLQAGCHVTAVCRSNYALVKEKGFRLSSIRYGNVTYKPSAVVRDLSECSSETVFDYVVVCTKSFPGTTPSLADQLRPVLEARPRTAVVLAQNGIGIEEGVRASFPGNPLLSGVVYCPALQTAPGVIEYPEMLNLLELGTYPAAGVPPEHKESARRFADLMIQGGGNAEVREDIQVARWSKLLMNAAWNPIGALTLTTDGDFLRTPDSTLPAGEIDPFAFDLAWGVMMEVVALAAAVGVEGVTVDVAADKMIISRERALAGTGREMSMLQDVKEGRPFEVEAIMGNAVRLGRDRAVPMPRLETLYALAKARSWALGR